MIYVDEVQQVHTWAGETEGRERESLSREDLRPKSRGPPWDEETEGVPLIRSEVGDSLVNSVTYH